MSKKITNLGNLYDVVEAIKNEPFSQNMEDFSEASWSNSDSKFLIKITRKNGGSDPLPYVFFVGALISSQGTQIEDMFKVKERSFVNAIPKVRESLVTKMRDLTIEIPTLKK